MLTEGKWEPLVETTEPVSLGLMMTTKTTLFIESAVHIAPFTWLQTIYLLTNMNVFLMNLGSL